MNSEKEIKRYIKQLNDTTRAELDKRVLDDAKQTLAAGARPSSIPL